MMLLDKSLRPAAKRIAWRYKSLRSLQALLAICALAPISCQSLHACNVPVFRYALERWPADPYRVVLYHRGQVDSTAHAVLQKNSIDFNATANYTFESVNTSSQEGKAIAESEGIGEIPWLQIFFPSNSAVRGIVWEGPLDLDAAKKIIDSPGRSALADRLLLGDAAVWVLLKSGESEKDGRASEILRRNLEKASATLKIPETGTDINGAPIEVTDFKDLPVRFSMIEISRHDPDEAVLVSLLLGSESDLEFYREPIAFPVFGRGRALYALVGAGINEETILNACRSIIAWCSCEIKAANAGIDLLISADWSNPFGGTMVKDQDLPPLTGLAEFLPDAGELGQMQDTLSAVRMTHDDSIIDGATACDLKSEDVQREINAAELRPEIAVEPSSPLGRNLMLLTGLGIVLVLAASLILKSKSGKQ